MLDRFAAAPEGTILLTTEVGSEGIDLQFCRLLINYDMPWNPMRLEQRIGRLDRIGQKADKIIIWNLMHEGTIDERIYTRLVDKLDLCRQSLGDFEAVLGEEIGELTRHLLRGRMSDQEQNDRIDQTAKALETRRHHETQLEEEAAGLAIQDEVLQRIEAQRDADGWITPADLRHLVTDFLDARYTGYGLTEIDADTVELQPTFALQHDLRRFTQEKRITEPTRLASSGRPVRCHFVNRVRNERLAATEYLSTFHPLVRFIRHELSLEPAPRPVGGIMLAGEHLRELSPDDYVLAAALWRVDGGRAVEKLVYSGAGSACGLLTPELAELTFLRGIKQGRTWLDTTTAALTGLTRLAEDMVMGELERRYRAFVDQVQAETDDRVRIQTERVESRLRRARAKHNQRQANRPDDSRSRRLDEGKLRKAEQRAAHDRQLAEGRRALHPRQEVVALAILRLEP